MDKPDRSRHIQCANVGSCRQAQVTAEAALLTDREPPRMSLSRYSSWRVGRNRISFTSTSSGWLMANATARANDSAGIATCA